jgi:hypothetical protein
MSVDNDRYAPAFADNGGAWPDPVAQPDEIAQAIVPLCSPEMPTLTGVALAVDSGRTLH